jgi:uncharacterized membrane protein YphA (DoxX/SURF4 family)
MTDPNVKSSWWILRLTVGIVPIIAGLDKFTNFLCDWKSYLSPTALDVIGASHAPGFMYLAGIVEIIAGIIVLSPAVRVGAYIVAAWLFCIACNLVLAHHFDIAVRDLVMALSSFTLGQLSAMHVGARAPARHFQPAPA